MSRVISDKDLFLLNDGSNTHFSSFSGVWSAIDLSLCSPSVAHRLEWEILHDLHGSDHLPIRISMLGIPVPQERQPKWLTKLAKWDLFRELLTTPEVRAPVNINEAVHHFTSSTIIAANVSIPKSSSRPRKPPVPWWNEECSKALRARRRALRKFQRSPSTANLVEFRFHRAYARRTFRGSRKASWAKYIDSISRTTPPSAVWKRLRATCGKPHVPPILGLEYNHQIATNPLDVANLLASSYAKVSSICAYSEEFQHFKIMMENVPLSMRGSHDLVLNIPFSINELDSAMESSDSAPGPDGLLYSMLRQLTPGAKGALLTIFNRIYLEQTFPKAWRESTIIPVLKLGKDKLNPQSYRPIALTSCVCKVLERMVNRRLVWFLEHNKLICYEQCGFRQGRSSIDQLVCLESAVQDAFLLRRRLIAVFFDIEKAYDTAWRRGILNKLSSWGIVGNMLAFIMGFMSDRYFRVRLGTTFSERFKLETGIPQGSVLSTTLFAIAINNITSCITAPVKCSLFVDDFAIYISSRRMANAERCLQLSIRRLEEWAHTTGFRFSVNKSQCICFSRLRGYTEPTLFLNNTQLPVLRQVRFLGMILDSRLTWCPHLKELRTKCLRVLDMVKVLSSSRWGADRTCLLRFYKALVRSRLDYGAIVYSSARPAALKMLDVIHNTGLRMATGAFRSSPVVSLLAESGEPPLSIRRHQLCLSYLTRLRSQPVNPAYEIVFHNPLSDLYPTRERAPSPVGVRGFNMLTKLRLEFPPMFEMEPCLVPPWTVKYPSFELSLTTLGKANTPSSVYVQEFRQIIDNYSPCDVVYTDGSKSDTSVGCAFISNGRKFRFGLPPSSTVYTSELTAIQKALSIVCPVTTKILICSDSFSSLSAVKDMYSKNPLVQGIWSALWDLDRQEIEVSFCWIPGHVGIAGNEMADLAARDALDLLPFTRRVISADFLCEVKKAIRSEWNHSWTQIQGNKLRTVKENTAPWITALRGSRREEVVLCRLRIGHSLLTHAHLMKQDNPPVCPLCAGSLTIRHVLLECPRMARKRREFGLARTLREVLQDDEVVVSRVLSYLRNVNLFEKL